MAPMVVVHKKIGLYADCCQLNKKITKDAYPSPYLMKCKMIWPVQEFFQYWIFNMSIAHQDGRAKMAFSVLDQVWVSTN